MKLKVHIYGLGAALSALRGMTAVQQKGVLRRVARPALKPMEEAAKAKVRRRSGELHDSIVISEQLIRSQRGTRDRSLDYEIFMGPSGLPQGIQEEFGNVRQAPHPFMRPAFDAEAGPTLERFASGLEGEVEKTARRVAGR